MLALDLISNEESFKLHLSLLKKSPLALKTLSDSTEVGGTTNNERRISLIASVSCLLVVNRAISRARVSEPCEF